MICYNASFILLFATIIIIIIIIFFTSGDIQIRFYHVFVSCMGNGLCVEEMINITDIQSTISFKLL
jgi:hypothetical protein